MSAINFAKKYVGFRFTIPNALLPPGVEEAEDYRYRAQLVGYIDDTNVVMEFEELEVRKYCWPIHDNVILVMPQQDMYDYHHPMVMAINYKILKEPRPLGSRTVKKQEVPSKPYPSLCKICHSPARNKDRIVMCSNHACISRSHLKKSLNIKFVKTNSLRCPFKDINDKVCKKAIYIALASAYTTKAILSCKDGHKFRSKININDVVLKQTINGNDISWIWSGKKWDMY